MIYVSPERLYLSYISNSGTAKGWTSLQPKVGYIPILRANLEAFKSEQLNNISRQNNGKVNQVYNAMAKNTKSSDSDANTTNQGTKEKKYQVLQQFLPTSLDQQLFMITIVLTEELNLNKSNKLLKEVNTLNETMRINILEEFLSLLVSDYDEIVSGWTVCELVKSEQDETLLFVRFNPSKTQEFLRFIRKFSKSKYIGIHYDENTRRFINDNAQQEEEVEGEEQSVVKLMKMAIDKCEREHSGESGQDDEESRTDYKIDYNTLLDIPRDSLDQLGKEIIDFRTKVISIEKEKQVRQQYEDNERRRKHMAQLFNKLLKSRNLDQMREEDEESSDDDEDDDDDIVMETKRKEADDRRYREMLRKLNTEIEPTLQRLHKQLVSAQEYETRLVEHREESIRNVQRTAQDTYYDHHRSFKDQEAQRDQRDRELHPSVTVSYTTAPKKKKKETIKINLAFKKAMETSTKEPEPDATATDRYQLRKLHVVEDLVKEYLGVEDEEVVSFVYDILEGDGDDEQKQKQLTEELEDLFDKEAPEFTQKLFSRF